MPYIQVGKDKLAFPPNMGSMPVEQGIALFKLIQERQEMEEPDSERLQDWIFRYLQAITQADKAILRRMPTDSAFEIVETINAVWANYEPQERKYITIKGIKYFFPLAYKAPLDKTTFGEWMDAMTLEKEHERLEHGELDAALHIMAIYCRPLDEETGDVEKFDNEKYEQRLQLFKQHGTTSDLLDFAFFLARQNRISLGILASSTVDAARQMLNKLVKTMDGTED